MARESSRKSIPTGPLKMLAASMLCVHKYVDYTRARACPRSWSRVRVCVRVRGVRHISVHARVWICVDAPITRYETPMKHYEAPGQRYETPMNTMKRPWHAIKRPFDVMQGP